ncbi:16774_t:CDS:2, partial [Acaulospora colombiana]
TQMFDRYKLGQGRSAQIDLLSDDEETNFYGEEDIRELFNIEKNIVNMFLEHLQCGFMSQNQILESYQQVYSQSLDWESFARTSDTTFEEFIIDTWNSFEVLMCPKDKATWIGVNLPNSPRIDVTPEVATAKESPYIKDFSRVMYDVKVWSSQHQGEDDEKAQMRSRETENFLWKLRHLVMDKTIVNTCCIKIMYRRLYGSKIKCKSLEKLLEESINWRKIGDLYMMIKKTDQKFGELRRKRGKPIQEFNNLSELQRACLSILMGEYFGDVLY